MNIYKKFRYTHVCIHICIFVYICTYVCIYVIYIYDLPRDDSVSCSFCLKINPREMHSQISEYRYMCVRIVYIFVYMSMYLFVYSDETTQSQPDSL